MTTAQYTCPDGTPFPVEWPHPAMAAHSWLWDQLHNPTPLTPLSQDLLGPKSEGMARGGAQTGTRFGGERFFANGYEFRRPMPSTMEEDELLARLAFQDWDQRVDSLLDRWNGSYRPETEALTRSLETWAQPGDSISDLLGRFDEIVAILGRLGELHSLAMGLSNAAMNRFQKWCVEKFGTEDGERISELSVGAMPNKSLESGQALWNLSRAALAMPAVCGWLRSRESGSGVEALADIERGDEFREMLDLFLETWGVRNESFSEIAFPSWREDPDFVLTTLGAYLAAGDNRSPSELHRLASERRESATNEARERLNDSGELEEFLVGRRRAQQRTVILEDHNYYIDQRAFSSLRWPILAVGKHLVALDVVDDPSDVFYLHESELHEAAEHPGLPWRVIVGQRKSDYQFWTNVVPPATIGEGETVMNPGMERILGPLQARVSRDGEIRGLAGSPGSVTGTARVVLTLTDAGRLGPGEILVTYATTPAWTPMFAIAAGVVTDSGGPLAHCAVVAREYGIPAVVGTKAATAGIPDGATITVDGTGGVVTIDE